MKIGKEELKKLQWDLEMLTEFIRNVEKGDLPYFYYRFDSMKNNINIYIIAGDEDIEHFLPVLERDWKASHMMFIGVQNYDIRKEHPDLDPSLYLYFAKLLAGVDSYFECRWK